ncbi:MAG TPA: glycosyltransferase family 87 protein [Bacteroidia bacterium]|nr:glycosyltransferase family 87 protein [Bacteroidia bacterium]
MLPKKTIPYKFILFATIILIADFVIENINHKFQLSDFKVYYEAARALTSGKQLYGVAFTLGSGYYKYSPFTALLFYPLSLLPYYAACVLDFALISASIIITTVILFNLFNKHLFGSETKFPNLLLSIALICIATHLVRELELGNVNILMLLVLCMALRFILQNKMAPAGLFIALVIITKPFFILLLIPLIMRRYFKTVIITCTLVAAFILLPALFLGFSKDWGLHKEWINTMLIHADAFPSPNTIEAVIRNNVNVPFTSNFQYIVMIILLIPYCLFISRNIKTSRSNENENSKNFIMEWITLLAIMPSLFKTDTEHFLMTLPIILYIIMYLFSRKNIPLTLLFIALILLYTGNSSDLLGKELSLKAYSLGILGISNVLLIIMAVYLFVTSKHKNIVT